MIYLNNNTGQQKVYIPKDEVVLPELSDYDLGYNAGVADQKLLLTSTTFTVNGFYQNENGWSGVTVDVDEQQYYDSGYTEGYASGYTSGYTSGSTDGYNTGYSSGYTDGSADGYASGNTDGYASGYTEGVDYQKSLLSAITIYNNGEYTREDGWSAVTVNVPTTVNNQSKEITISTANTITTLETGITVLPDSGYTGLSDVIVKTDFKVVDDLAVVLTGNGQHYILDAEHYGLGEENVIRGWNVLVDVTAATSTINLSVVSDNISGLIGELSVGFSANSESHSAITLDNSAVMSCVYKPGFNYNFNLISMPSGYYCVKQIAGSGITMWEQTTAITYNINTIPPENNITCTTINGVSTQFNPLYATVVSGTTYSYEQPRVYGWNNDGYWELGYSSAIIEGLEIAAGSIRTELTSFVFIDTVEKLKGLYNCTALTDVAATGVTELVSLSDAWGCFEGCTTLTGVTLPNVTTLGVHSFKGCESLLDIDLSKVEKISDLCFYNCYDLTGITSNNMNYIGEEAFFSCHSLTSIDLSKVKTIDKRAFSDCDSLTSVTLSSIETIGNHAFYSCSALTTVTIGENCTSLGDAIFSVNSITFLGNTPPSITNSTFSILPTTGTLYIPYGSVTNYQTVIAALPSGWSVVEQ